MKEWKNIIYLSMALGMLIYAVPRLEIGHGVTFPTLFGIAWICFALLVVASHLHRILGVDEETKRELARIGKQSRRQKEQWLRRNMHMLEAKK